jgi:hypothetical protein
MSKVKNILKNKKIVTFGVGLLIFFLGYFTSKIYKKNFSDKAKLEKCADINILANWLTGKITKSSLIEITGEKKGMFSVPLKEKLLHNSYNKVWDECVNELKNSSIKFYEKYPSDFNFKDLFKL